MYCKEWFRDVRDTTEWVLTDVFEDFVALIEDEHLEVFQVERLVLGEVQDTARCSYDNVWSFWPLEKLFLLLDRLATEDTLSPDVWDEFGETHEFALNLVGELASVSEDEDAGWLWALTDAMER